jgi:hypothetical protein
MNATIKKISSFLAVLIVVLLLQNCSESDTPDSTTKVVTNLPLQNGSIVTFGGKVESDGGSPVTERGVVIGYTANPDINDVNTEKLDMGAGLGDFSNDYDLSSIPSGTEGHVRAYAINAAGVFYGEDKLFIVGGGNPTSCNVINITSNITTPTTWTAGNVYLVENWINVNAPLVIQPGVIIKFKNGNAGMEVFAKITADATAANPIIFTSYKDDSYCGDSNEDGTASTPAKGDWGRLTMRGDQHGSVFRYCKFLWGGASNGGVIKVNTGTGNIHDFTFDHCTFAHTAGTNIYNTAAFNGGEMYDESISVVTNNVFYDNAIPIYIWAKYGLSSSNVYHNPDNAGEINKYNGIFVYGGNMGGRSVVYGETEVPYVFNVSGNATLSVGSSDFLKIDPNVIIKFGQTYAGLDLGDYPNNANISGTAVFTSYRDDTRGGDTNGDGSTSSPATGDWSGYGYWTTGHGSYVWVQNNVFYDSH